MNTEISKELNEKINEELKILSNDLLMIDKDERIKNLETALKMAIDTIEMECDDHDYLNELKSVLNG